MMELWYDSTPVYNTSLDLCDVVKNFAPCPIKPGKYFGSSTLSIPSWAFSVSLSLLVSVEGPSSNQL